MKNSIDKVIIKVDSKKNINPRVENKILEEDEDAVVAAMVASIDYYYETKFNDQLIKDNSIVYSVRLNLWAKLWNKLEVHASGNYRSPQKSLFAERQANYSINCGLRADFFDRKMSVHINVNDIFNWNKWDNNITNPYYQSYSSFKFNSRSISAGLVFRFGKMELERKARVGGGEVQNPGVTM